MTARPFHVGLTRECFGADGKLVFDPIALEPLRTTEGVTFAFFDEPAAVLSPEHAASCDAIICRGPRVERGSLEGPNRRVRLIARFGAGVDKTDIDACTQAGVIVTNTPDAIRRPVATAILLLILVLSHRLMDKERVAREARWADRLTHMGQGLVGRTVGSIGLGNIAQELFHVLRPLDMRHIGYARRPDRAAMAGLGVELVEMNEVFSRSDFVCLNVPLTRETTGMIGQSQLALMKPTAYLINTARGAVVDESALHRALHERRIAGAALDVFAQEPLRADNPLLKLDNVIVTPHSLAVTDDCNRDIAASAIRSTLQFARGEAPTFTYNRAVLDHPEIKALLS